MEKKYFGILIDENKISDLADLDNYWNDCLQFLIQIDGRQIISGRQREWLESIGREHRAAWNRYFIDDIN